MLPVPVLELLVVLEAGGVAAAMLQGLVGLRTLEIVLEMCNSVVILVLTRHSGEWLVKHLRAHTQSCFKRLHVRCGEVLSKVMSM